MTFNQILYFQKVANLENYHQAAEELYISQPSLSRSMASLEKELGVMLFEKEGRGVKLTKAGHMFLDYANRILSDCNIAVGKMQELASDGGKIDIGYVFPLAGHYIPHRVKLFLERPENQKVVFNFWQNHTPAIIKKVRSGELDVGFGGCPEKDDMEYFPVRNQKLIIITPQDHPLAGQASIPLTELNRYPVIGYDRDTWMGSHTRALYAKYDIHPDIIVECPDEYSIVALVRENFGIALMPHTDILAHAPGVSIHAIEDLEVYNRVFMYWIKDRYRLPAVDRFIEYMKEMARLDGVLEEEENDSKNVLKIYLKDIVNF